MVAPTIGLAFLAGLLSFISPCVLPLVPAYIGYMGGRVTHTVAIQQASGTVIHQSASNRFITLLHGLAFVAGFTFIFVVLGLLTTAFIMQIGRQNVSLIETIIARAGGVLVIFFGLHFMGIMPSLFRRALERPKLIGSPLFSLAVAVLGGALILWATVDLLIGLPVLVIFLLWLALGGALTRPLTFWQRTLTGLQTALYSDTRKMMTARSGQGFAGSAVMGIVFAAGWTPCIGPVYGAVLTMAANGGDVGQAGTLLGAYSLGLGIPFLLAAVLLDSAQSLLRRIQKRMHIIELVTGSFLVVMGVLIATGRLQQLSNTFAGQFDQFSSSVETCVLGFANGEIPLGQVGPCLNGETVTASSPASSGFEFLETAPTAAPAATQESKTTGLNTITGLAQARAQAPSGAAPGIEVGNRAVDFSAQTDDGQSIRLMDLRGKVVFVNFWATWCGPCREEMPTFDRAYRENGGKTLAVLAVNNRETPGDIAAFRREVSVGFPLALDESGSIQQLYGVRQYPTTLVVDAAGVIRARHVGPLSASDIESLVRRFAS